MSSYKQHLSWLLLFSLAQGSFAYAGKNTPSQPTDIVGKYACTFSLVDNTGTYNYPSFTCIIRKQNNQLELEKLGGSQRIKGPITVTKDGFSFDGAFFFPYGDCDAKALGNFQKTTARDFKGTIFLSHPPNEKIVVELKKK